MFLINVIPISRGIGSETLSYFSKDELAPGTLVRVELRKRTIPALVVGSESVSAEKSGIKSASFSLKKISNILDGKLVQPEALEAARDAARYFATTTGSVIHHLLSKTILDEAEKTLGGSIQKPRDERPQQVLAIQADDTDRIAHYKGLIRESFARGASLFICVPGAHDASRMKGLLSKGIEEYTITLHGSLSKKNILESWNKAKTIAHPVLIIGTGLFVSIPRADIKMIVIEREHSSSYRIQSRPFLDYRYFIELYAKKIGATVVLGDNLLRIETLWRIEEGLIHEHTPLAFRALNKPRQMVIDMRPYSKQNGGTFAVFSKELIEEIQTAERDLRKIILFSTRRGLATETICGDCGNVVRCSHCKAPVVLHKSSKGTGANFFLCHHCGERRDAHERCSVCESWKLIPLGIGTERVEEELERVAPKLPRFRLDLDTAKTSASAQKIIREFNAAASGVLVGTEALLHHEIEPADACAIVSLDALFAIPDFRIHEKIVHLILGLRNLTQGPFLLQSRNPEEPILNDALTGHLANFYRREIEIRKQFSYPPFSTLLKITAEGNKDSIAALMEKLSEYIKPREISIFPAFVRSGKASHALHGVIKIPKNEWIDEELLKKLATLPPHVRVNVNPESIL